MGKKIVWPPPPLETGFGDLGGGDGGCRRQKDQGLGGSARGSETQPADYLKKKKSLCAYCE